MKPVGGGSGTLKPGSFISITNESKKENLIYMILVKKL
jgi:hypothetical protein